MIKDKQDMLRQILISILVGTAITFLTQLLQGLIVWLQAFNATDVGSITGAVTYLSQRVRGIS